MLPFSNTFFFSSTILDNKSTLISRNGVAQVGKVIGFLAAIVRQKFFSWHPHSLRSEASESQPSDRL